MTSNFCKTSWHPYGHTPEECPDCRLCHESKIPKKLEFRPHLTTGVIARDRDMEMLVLWLNELRDYLQAKEEASKSSWHTFWSDSKKCVCCNKTLKELEKSKEASKGECTVVGCEEPMPHLHDLRIGCRNPEPHKFGSLPCCEGLNPPESKGECECICHDPSIYRPHKEGHGCCDRALRTNFTHKFEPDKNGKCWCNIPKESSYHYQIDPPESEESWEEWTEDEKRYGFKIKNHFNKGEMDYIRDNFVSKEKIKREVKEWRFVQRGRLVNISDLFKRLGIGLEEL